jgi:hypothetical protein
LLQTRDLLRNDENVASPRFWDLIAGSDNSPRNPKSTKRLGFVFRGNAFFCPASPGLFLTKKKSR